MFKNKLFLLIFLLICADLKAQEIHGRVLESGTNKPVAGAQIYIAGTSLVTTSDSAGNFALKTTLNNKFPVITSSMGYATVTTSLYSANESLEIHLEPKPFQLKTVMIGSDGMSMNQKIDIFKREFLGKSSLARKCEIENIDDIEFSYNKKTGVLTASSDKPVIVYNKELGYKLRYFLSGFRFAPGLTSLNGNELFEEDSSAKEVAANTIKEKREAAYLGSRMHFIRSLWNNDLDENNFKIYDDNYKRLNYNDVIVVKNNQKYIRPQPPLLRIRYKNKESYIQFRREIYIDKNGFYSAGITWREDMGNQRIGDLLPLEYQLSGTR